ncbi:hypothetical protein E3N88_18517 [Mikania micrantha]|uniref:Uncharacterized protein n=1 Tax=Mikania micrantha TaxID=192012 RepID=A0A5N6NKL9_9ASTR|nr:hypothetical protein E3N88_18517 [Mikania micrantha]
MFESDASSRKCDDNLNKNDIEKDRLNDVNEKLFDEFVVEKQKENFDIYLQEYCDDSTQQIQNKEHFNEQDKKYPPKLSNGCEIDLLDLYMYDEETGYLDLMTWRYNIAKEDESKVGEPSFSYLVDDDVGKESKVNEDETIIDVVQEENETVTDAVQNEHVNEEFEDVDLCLEDYDKLEDILFLDEVTATDI